MKCRNIIYFGIIIKYLRRLLPLCCRLCMTGKKVPALMLPSLLPNHLPNTVRTE